MRNRDGVPRLTTPARYLAKRDVAGFVTLCWANNDLPLVHFTARNNRALGPLHERVRGRLWPLFSCAVANGGASYTLLEPGYEHCYYFGIRNRQ